MTARVFDHRQVWRLDPETFTEATSLLAHTAVRRVGPVDAVVGIARGGVEPATAIATFLQVPSFTVSARHNVDDRLYRHATGIVGIDLDPALSLTGLRVLIVDDIVGTGATLDTVRDALRTRAGATETYSAALCRNAGSAVIPDLWIWTVRDWVTFPWERVAPAPATTPLPFPRSARWHA